MSFYKDSMAILSDYVAKEHKGNVKAASRALGLDPDMGILYKWLKGRNIPRADLLGDILDKIGAKVSARDEESATIQKLQIKIQVLEEIIQKYLLAK